MRAPLVPPPVWMLLCGLLAWALHRYEPILRIIPGHWNRLGWLMMALAPIVPGAAFIQFWRAHTTANPHTPEAATSLVTSGVYAWTRNPMYLGLSILLAGWAIELGTLSPLAGPVLFVLIIRFAQLEPEERALRRRFPAEYEAYCRSVHRWIGRRRRPTPLR